MCPINPKLNYYIKATENMDHIHLTLMWGLGALNPHAVENVHTTFNSPQI